LVHHDKPEVSEKVKRLKVPTFTGKPKQQRRQSGVLISTSSTWRGAISSRPLPKQTDFWPAVAQQTQPVTLRPIQQSHWHVLINVTMLVMWLYYSTVTCPKLQH